MGLSKNLAHVSVAVQIYPWLIRTVPTFATAHTFCTSWDGLRKSGFLMTVLLKQRYILAQFITTREKYILGRVIVIRKENWG